MSLFLLQFITVYCYICKYFCWIYFWILIFRKGGAQDSLKWKWAEAANRPKSLGGRGFWYGEQCPLELKRNEIPKLPIIYWGSDIPRLALRTHFGFLFPHPNSLFQGCRDHDCDDSRSRRCKLSISKPLSYFSPSSLCVIQM